MKHKMMQTILAAAVMMTAAAETFGGDKMQSSILTKKECAVVDIGSAVERGVLYGTGAYEKGEVRDLAVFREAYEAGKNC